MAKQLANVDLKGLKDVIDQCLNRDSDWVKVSKKTLLKEGATIEHKINAAESQKMLLAAYRLNPNVLRPLEGVAYQKLSPHAGAQAAAIQSFHQGRFLEGTDRLLYANQLIDDLVFEVGTADRFESAIDSVAEFIGIKGQRPEKLFGEGPDNLWAMQDGAFLVIECKSSVTSDNGISKADAGQLGQAMTWFCAKYPAAAGTPVVVHPHRNLGPGATAVAGMRVITEDELKELRKALDAFAKALSDPDTLNNVKKIKGLVDTYGFGTEFLERYTRAPK
jgi:hypothetical protein